MPFDQIKDSVVAYQQRCLEESGDSARGVDWKSQEAQYLLFRVIRSMGIGPHSSVLDVGCGLAHLYDFLAADGYVGRYTGVDIAPALIEQAGTRLPGVDLRVVDILEDGPDDESYDFVVASGVFSARMDTPREEFERYVETMIRRMYRIARVGTVFNMLTSYVDFEVPHLYYADPARYLTLARSLTRFVTLKHDFPAYFFTLGLYRAANDYSTAG